MASRILLTPLANRGPLFLGLGAATALFCSPLRRSQILRADSGIAAASSPKDWSFSQYQHDASTPVVKRDGGLNPRAIKQISQGSILGVLGGLAVSMFSKSLAVLLGLLICGVQFIESRGIHIIPYGRLQKYFTNIDLRSAVQDNVAFKLSFGATFALAGFADF